MPKLAVNPRYLSLQRIEDEFKVELKVEPNFAVNALNIIKKKLGFEIKIDRSVTLRVTEGDSWMWQKKTSLPF